MPGTGMSESVITPASALHTSLAHARHVDERGGCRNVSQSELALGGIQPDFRGVMTG